MIPDISEFIIPLEDIIDMDGYYREVEAWAATT